MNLILSSNITRLWSKDESAIQDLIILADHPALANRLAHQVHSALCEPESEKLQYIPWYYAGPLHCNLNITSDMSNTHRGDDGEVIITIRGIFNGRLVLAGLLCILLEA